MRRLEDKVWKQSPASWAGWFERRREGREGTVKRKSRTLNNSSRKWGQYVDESWK